jgi:MFS-type transporter involved in bile tolerance (Atg22 family)
MNLNDPGRNDRKTYWMNLTLAGLAGQVGCLTLVIILGAVFLGLWLDAHFQTRPWLTIGLVVVSIPISLGLMFFVVRKAVARIKTGPSKENKSQ